MQRREPLPHAAQAHDVYLADALWCCAAAHEHRSIKSITFEGGSLTDATTGVDSTSGTVNLETSAPLKESYSATIPNNSTGNLSENFTGVDDFYVSFYIKPASFPAGARIAQIQNSGTTVGNIVLNSSGTLQLRNGSTTIGSASAALSANTLYRIGLHQRKGSGSDGILEAFVATGDAAFGTPFASSASESFTTQASKFVFGATNSNAVDATFDDIKLDSAAMPGPSGGGSPTATPTNTPTNTPTGPTATPTATATPAPTAPPAYDISMSYDALGNLTSKTGVGTYGYGAQSASCPAGALDKAHAVVTAGGASYCYDRNGNMQTGNGWTYTWNADHTLASMTNGTAPESYTYDADGERVVRTAAGVTTVFFEGVWEQTTAGARKLYYTFNGQVVAMRDSSGVTYLHGDHLGSVSVATNSTGTGYNTQEFDPWGQVRSGSVPQTSFGYTGQRLDATGLLYYHARYYNPLLARFISADSVVPGNASGGMDGVALKGLTVDFHEPGFVSKLDEENGFGIWFQLSDDDKQQLGSPWGPANPQALNRYSYVLNAPVRWTDPSGHCIWDACVIEGAVVVAVIVEVVIPAVVGAVVIAGAYVAGGELGRAHAASQNHKTGTALESRWQDRDSDVGPVRVRKLRNSEVSDDLHRSKKARGMGAKDSYYVDEEGNIYSGGDDGELTLEEPAESGDD